MAELEFAATLADRGLDAAFTIPPGEVLAVVGPNGAGKSTVAAVIAGLLAADRAVVRVGGRILTDTARGVDVPTHQRRVGLLQQDPLLFPHLSVLGNVEFAARCGGDRSGAMRRLEQVGATELAGRKPRELSGGQAQRVALARALAAEPDVLVLDEPLSGLDVDAAASVRAVLSPVLTAGGRAALLITHDLLDVLALADRLVVLEDGHVAESGPVAEVLATPRSRFGARIAGLNLVRGALRSPGVLEAPDGRRWHGVAAGPLTPGDDVVAVFAPAAVAVYPQQPQGSPRNATRVRIAGLELHGPAVRVRADPQADGNPGLAADVTAEAVADLGLKPGEEVWFTVKAQAIALHPAARTAAPAE